MEFFESYYGWVLLLITIVFIFAYKKLTKNPNALTSKFESKQKVNGKPTDNLKLIEQALKNAGFKNVEFHKEKNCFYAQTKFSMSSFSEYIEVSLSQNNSSTELKFTSICSLPTQVIDWGKNRRNYNKFNKRIGEVIG